MRDYIARSNEFNVKLFKILGLGGIAVSILTCIYSLFEISYVSSITCLIVAILAAFLLYYVEKTEKYVFGYIVTEIGVFMTLFTILFFGGGGIEGSLPYFFAFSMIFIFLMFQNKLLIAMEALLALVYLIDCYVAFYIPKSLVTELSQEALFYEKLVGIFLSALSMGLIIDDNYLFLENKIFKDMDQRKQLHIYPPENGRCEVIAVYEKEDAELQPDNGHYLSVDLGLHNLMTCYDSDGNSFILGRKYLVLLLLIYKINRTHILFFD